MNAAAAGRREPLTAQDFRPRVLVMVDYYLPGFRAGGPIRSISNLAVALQGSMDLRIVTRDRDLGDREPYPPGSQLRSPEVTYTRAGWRGLLESQRLLKEQCDLLYLNSFFSPKFSMLPLLLWRLGLTGAASVLLAPRGEFSPGALAIKPWRKRVYLWVAGRLGLYEGVTWHASSPFEAEDIRRIFGDRVSVGEAVPLPDQGRNVIRPRRRNPARILTAMDLPGAPGKTDVVRSRSDGARRALRVVFISRISPKKNLDGALRMLAKVRGAVSFAIFGPVDDEAYWQKCRALMEALPSRVRTSYHGAVPHGEVGRVLAEADLFLFPTHGENYGHVVLEALCAGVPVLVSDQTPWQDLEREGVGRVIPLGEEDSFVNEIEAYGGMSDSQLDEISARCARYGLRRATNPQLIEDNRNLLLQAIGREVEAEWRCASS